MKPRFTLTVLRDTREQAGHGWTFPADGKACLGTEVRTLPTGDYAVAGLEDKCLVERKGSPAEFCANLFEPRFARELDRLAAVPHAYVLLEFGPADLLAYPRGSGVPEARWPALKVTAALFHKRFWEAALAHPRVHFVFVGRSGPAVALGLFKRVAEKYAA